MSGAPTIHVTWEEFQQLIPAGHGGCYAEQLLRNLHAWALPLPLVSGQVHPLQVLSGGPLPMLHPHRPEAMPTRDGRVTFDVLDEDLDEDLVDEDLEDRRSVVTWAVLPAPRGAP